MTDCPSRPPRARACWARSAETLRQVLTDAASSSLAAIYSRCATPGSRGLTDSDLDVEALLGFGLTVEENLLLLHTNLEEETVSLILRGLKRIHRG